MTMQIGHNLIFCNQYPTRACVTGNGEVRSLWDNVASFLMNGNRIVRRGCDCQHQSGQELGLSGTVNKSKVSINVVTRDKRKMLLRLGQNGKWSGIGVPNSSIADAVPPAKRHNLTHSDTHTQRGKPVVLLKGFYTLEGSKPQGEPKGLREWDDGRSEC